MRLAMRAVAVALALWGVPAFADPEVGDLFDTPPGQDFRGWKHAGGAIADDGTTSALFEQAGVHLIALTTPIARTAKGGITAEKITKIERVSARPGEDYVGDCDLLGAMPAVAFYSKTSGIARGYFVFRDEIREQRWFPSAEEPCQDPGD
jgi:hypothetical protein